MAKPTRTDDSLRVDWFRVLLDMRRRGYSQVAVAREAGIPRSTLQQWCSAACPVQAKFEDGLRVITLWCAITEQPVERLPWINRFAPHPSLSTLIAAKLPGLRQVPKPTMPRKSPPDH
jgi:lambda repressor-like predicted transcriptional regulator